LNLLLIACTSEIVCLTLRLYMGMLIRVIHVLLRTALEVVFASERIVDVATSPLSLFADWVCVGAQITAVVNDAFRNGSRRPGTILTISGSIWARLGAGRGGG